MDMTLEVVVPVSDIDVAARFSTALGWRLDADLGTGDSRGVQLTPPGSRCSIPDPERRSYASHASFTDPDGNGWLLDEITQRLPGR